MNHAGKVIALEEHFWIPEARNLHYDPEWLRRLDDLGELRLKEMDEAGIDLQVISHAPPAAQNLAPADAIAFARKANDMLHESVLSHPDRFAGFAMLPTPDPEASAAELERTVTKYGFKGAMIHGTTNGEFSDEKRFWCIYERAQALDVPIYIHPGAPHPALMQSYYKGYPAMAMAGWGFNVEAATHGIRLILSGIFDSYPRLRIILGHLGEALPFSLWRCDALLSRDVPMKRRFKEYFLEHFHITTSGNFSHAALQCCLAEMGADRVMFSIDWPYASNREGRDFIDTAPIGDKDKNKILRLNAAKLLRI